VPKATAWRYVEETAEVLAAWTPGLHEALVGPGEAEYDHDHARLRASGGRVFAQLGFWHILRRTRVMSLVVV
jgi:hypothetical protein